jgi:hypothetical protein
MTKKFFSSPDNLTGSGTNPGSYSMETWGLSLGMKQSQREADHSSI